MPLSMLSKHFRTPYKCMFSSSLSDLMKSTEVDVSLSTTSTDVLFQRIPTKFKIEYLHLFVWLCLEHTQSSLLEREYNSIISISPMDVGNTNLSNGYTNWWTASCTQTLPNSVKVSDVCQQGNKAVRKYRLHIQKFKSLGHSSYHSI